MLGKLVQVLQADGRVNWSTYVKRRSARRYRSRNGVPQSERLGSNPQGWFPQLSKPSHRS